MPLGTTSGSRFQNAWNVSCRVERYQRHRLVYDVMAILVVALMFGGLIGLAFGEIGVQVLSIVFAVVAVLRLRVFWLHWKETQR